MTAGLRQTAERDGEDGGRRIHVVQGEYHVSGDDDAVLTTILGSCVSACLRDPLAGIGGMNHFLLPGDGSQRRQEAQSYGVHLMELLVNGLLRRGARRERLEAKLFGGASTVQGLSNVGTLNADFAESFLGAEGIHVIGGSLRGSRGRRVQYWPISGRARQVFLAADLAPPPVFTAPLAQAGTGGNVEFF